MTKHPLPSLAAPAAFFVFFFLFLLLYINPQIINTCNGVSLRAWVRFTHAQASAAEMTRKADSYAYPGLIPETTPAYFRQEVLPPGGMARLVIALVMEASASPVAGALLVTAFAWLLWFFVPLFSRQSNGPSLRVAQYLLPLWLLVACAWYEFSVLFWAVPLLAACMAACAYQRMRPGRPLPRAGAMTTLFWAAWYICGPASILFLALVLIHDFFTARRALPINVPVAAINAMVLFLVESRIVPLEHAMDLGFLLEPPLPPVIAIAAVPAVVVLFHSATVRFFLRARADKILSLKIPASVRPAALLLFAVAAVGWTVIDPVNRDTRTAARTLHFLLEKRWEKILNEDYSSLYRNFPAETNGLQVFTSHAVCRAQYETGRLGSDLFTRPLAQFSAEPLMLQSATLVHGFANWIAGLDLYANLGLVNLAEKVTGETMECMGPYGFLVLRRAQLQAAKGNGEAAAIYARRLAGMPRFRREARKILALLADSAALAADSRIAHLRSCMDTSDYFLFSSREETMLQSMLASNPANKMAYEYLMACYLLAGRPDRVAGEIGRAAGLGYAQVPRHWQEALCIAMAQDSVWASRAAELPVRPETMDRFDRFMQRYSLLENNPAAAPRELEAEFGDSYFYFYSFEFTRGARR